MPSFPTATALDASYAHILFKTTSSIVKYDVSLDISAHVLPPSTVCEMIPLPTANTLLISTTLIALYEPSEL